ncbi:phosphoglycerate mutase [Coralloluteibacterium thermophilus]|uniref:Phosphoglycerate mutase n=1 Tax=Coralloluteibacterium thermophilum TaxID=2707049 RepID=A0ABV9NGV4_9GAMM
MLTLLLPPAARLGGALGRDAGLRLARADRGPAGREGFRAQLERHFELLPRGWPMAALTRQQDAGDAGGQVWLRADPAHVRVEINGGRLLACGGFGLAPAEVEDLLRPLKPLFGDAGCPISAPHPDRWYLMLPPGTPLPAFSEPDAALGDELLDHLPEGPEGRRWRALMNEAQIVLHNHPLNAARAQRGLPAINALWFWGGGVLPDAVRSQAGHVRSGDAELRALAAAAGLRLDDAADAGDALLDLRGVRDAGELERDWLAPAFAALDAGDLDTLVLDLADGQRWTLRRGQRWRLWRRRPAAFAS